MSYGIVYKATNVLNGKGYVGQTTRNFQSYIKEHFNKARRHEYKTRYFYRAIRKYGQDAFKWEILCECYSAADLSIKEQEFIQQFNTCGAGGYNMNEGGEQYRYERTYDKGDRFCSKGFEGKTHTTENKQFFSNNMKEKWNDPTWRRNQSSIKKRRRVDAAAMEIIDPSGNVTVLTEGLEQFCIRHNLPFTTIRRWVNRGKIYFTRKPKKQSSLNAIGWEIKSTANYYA